jgi:hypothetical protein
MPDNQTSQKRTGQIGEISSDLNKLIGDQTSHASALHLVACVKEKAETPAPAAALYRSTWFRKARAYVEGVGAPWFILSALHGLVSPDQVIEPYERTLMNMPAVDRRAWGQHVVRQLDELGYPATARVVVLAGARYREPLAAWLGTRAVVPMAGLSIGRQLAWLTECVRNMEDRHHG